MPRISGRIVDYTQDDMMQMTNLTRSQFRRGLERICDMYHFDINDFKVEKDNIDSKFFFIPEIAELLAILLRNLKYHPLKRINAKVDEITGTAISTYYEKIIEDIDDKVRPEVADFIYCREGHLVAQNISDWTEQFVKQLTRFLINLTTLKRQDVGESLKQFTKQLDQMNYYLFRGDSVISMVIESNLKEMKKQSYMDDEYHEGINKKLYQNNISIDWLIAEMIRWYLPRTKAVRENNFLEYEFIDNDFKWNVGGAQNQASQFQKRELYYKLEVNGLVNKALLKNNKHILDVTREKNAKWIDIPTQISNGTFCEPSEKSLTEKIKIIEEKIANCERELEEYKKILSELKQQENGQQKSELLKKIQREYVNYCEQTDIDYVELESVVDKFVGRAIHELLR